MNRINTTALYFAVAVFCFAGSIYCASAGSTFVGTFSFLIAAFCAALNSFLFMKNALSCFFDGNGAAQVEAKPATQAHAKAGHPE